MRNPNGFGSVYKLSGHRRRPWTVRKTIGWTLTENGRAYPKYVFLGYYSTRKEAMEALRSANFVISPDYKATIGELYSAWSKKHFESIGESRRTSITSAWRLLEPLFSKKLIKDLNLQQISTLLHEIKAPTMARVAKVILGQIYDYAIQQEIIAPEAKSVFEYIDLSDIKVIHKVKRKVYTKEEIGLLWSHSDRLESKVLLVLLYSGLRSGELYNLKKEDIHFEDKFIDIKRAKTASGVRQVPIHSKILSLLKGLFSDTYFLAWSKNHIYYRLIPRFLNELGIEHTLHDTRHTFISRMTEIGADPRILKQIVGHASQGVTESVYTHIDLQTKLRIINVLDY